MMKTGMYHKWMNYVCAKHAKPKSEVGHGVVVKTQLQICGTDQICESNHLWELPCCSSVGGVTVSMVAFQAVDPGSTPGRRTRNFVLVITNNNIHILQDKPKNIWKVTHRVYNSLTTNTLAKSLTVIIFKFTWLEIIQVLFKFKL